MRLARELDYTPAAAARSLKTQRSHVIGVFLETGEGHPDLQHPFFHEVLGGLKNTIGAGRLRPAAVRLRAPRQRLRHALLPQALPPPQRRGRRAHGRRPRGRRGAPARALRGPVRRRRRRACGRHRAQRRRPTTRAARASPCAICTSSGTAASRRSPACSRRARAPTACAATGASCRRSASPTATSYVAYGDFYAESGRAGMRQLLALDEPPTAVFAASDMMALGAIRAAADAGLRVPARPLGRRLRRHPARRPRPAAADHAAPGQGRARRGRRPGADRADRRRAASPRRPRSLPVELVVRGSTAPPRAG